MILAAKVFAGAAIDLIENPEYLKVAKAEFEKAAKGGYVCPIPENEYAKPVEI